MANVPSSDAALARLVGRSVKRTIGPLVESMGFEWHSSSEASMPVGDGTFAFQWKRVGAKFARLTGFPSTSIIAGFAVEYGARVPASFVRDLPPRRPQHDQMSIRLVLSRTEPREADGRYPDVWPIASATDADWAIEDLKRAITTQGATFVETWSDPAWVYHELDTQTEWQLEGGIGVAALQYPGVPGSPNRRTHLAVLADLCGNPAAEKLQLQRLLEQDEWPRYRARLDELERTTRPN